MKKNLLRVGFCILMAAVLFLLHNYSYMQHQSAFAFAEEYDQKEVYLTFDDGPSDSTTPYILDVLKEEGVKATFFVIGQQIKYRPAIIERIKNEGHAFGLHSFTHAYKTIYASSAALLRDIKRCADELYAFSGVKTDLYRFPGGSFTVRKELKEAVAAAGYRSVDWNASCRDAEIFRPTADELYAAAVESIANKPFVVLLMHDSAHHRATATALPRIIRYFKDRGYVFKTL